MADPEIDAMLRTAQVGRLGLCHDNQPYLVPLNFVYENGCIYAHCAETGMKLDYLRDNPRVCFEVDEHIRTATAPVPCDHETVYRSVIAFGRARILTTIEEKTAALKLIVSKYAGPEQAGNVTNRIVDSYKSPFGGKTTLLGITIDRMTGKHHEPQQP
jgi:nitroimidazol reductase NimA-like FMN-containing flavoprotein (pyridoxamine 5'-phosphate oxidase superfamily)